MSVLCHLPVKSISLVLLYGGKEEKGQKDREGVSHSYIVGSNYSSNSKDSLAKSRLARS